MEVLVEVSGCVVVMSEVVGEEEGGELRPDGSSAGSAQKVWESEDDDESNRRLYSQLGLWLCCRRVRASFRRSCSWGGTRRRLLRRNYKIY